MVQDLDYLGQMSVVGSSSSELFVLDFSGGSFVPAAGLLIDGGGGDDTVVFEGLSEPVDLTRLGITYSGIGRIAFADGSVSISSWPAGVGLVATGTAVVTVTQSITVAGLSVDGMARWCWGRGPSPRPSPRSTGARE